MRTLATLTLGLLAVAGSATRSGVTAAPVPPPGPSIEGKYTLLLSGTSGPRGKGGFGAADAADRGGFGGPGGTTRRETTVTRNTIVIDGRTSTYEYKLDHTTKPMGIDLTIMPLRGTKPTRAVGIVEVRGDRVLIAYAPEGAERPKDFEDAEGVNVLVLQKAPPPPRTEYKIVALRVGREADTEKALNELAKEGYEVAFTTTPVTPPTKPGGAAEDPVVHLVLKRTVR